MAKTKVVESWYSILQDDHVELDGPGVFCMVDKSSVLIPKLQAKRGFIYKDNSSDSYFFYDGKAKHTKLGNEGVVNNGKLWFYADNFTKEKAEKLISDYFQEKAHSLWSEAKRCELMSISFLAGEYDIIATEW